MKKFVVLACAVSAILAANTLLAFNADAAEPNIANIDTGVKTTPKTDRLPASPNKIIKIQVAVDIADYDVTKVNPARYAGSQDVKAYGPDTLRSAFVAQIDHGVPSLVWIEPASRKPATGEVTVVAKSN